VSGSLDGGRMSLELEILTSSGWRSPFDEVYGRFDGNNGTFVRRGVPQTEMTVASTEGTVASRETTVPSTAATSREGNRRLLRPNRRYR
jgi:hypothetical protein